MKDKIYKYSEYIKENIEETPEQYVSNALTKLKSKLEKMFSTTTDQQTDQEVQKFGEIKSKEKKEKGDVSFGDLGLELQSIELSKYSKVFDNVKLIFSDEKARYDAIFTINLEDAVPKNTDRDFSDTKIKECQVKFKKYSNDNFELIGQLTKTVKIDEIDEDTIIDLKIELDDEYGSEEQEEFKIETE